MKYPDDFVNQILENDCLEVMKEIPDDSIDLCVTDPPYQLSSITHRYGKKNAMPAKSKRKGDNDGFQGVNKGFMGKKWDVLPLVETWKECLRVLKPGAFAFIMITPRQDSLCQILCDLRDAGFQMGFSSIYWTFASGFPKASNIGKMVDKRMGVEREVIGEGQKGRNLTRPKGYKGDMAIDELHQESIAPKITKGTSKFEGSYGGFQPKPAVEIILVAMKPLLEKSYIDQALKNKKGITWLSDCRIPAISKASSHKQRNPGTLAGGGRSLEEKYGKPLDTREMGWGFKRMPDMNPSSRFPANLLCSDDVLNTGENVGYGNSEKPYSYKGRKYKVEGFIKDNSPEAPSNYGDTGSFSRYFDLDAWWKDKIKNLPKSIQRTFPFMIVSKPGRREKDRGLESGSGGNTYNRKCLTCGKWERKQGFSDKYTCHCEEPKWKNDLEGEIKHYTKNRRCKICGRQQVSGSPCRCENPEWEIIERPVLRKGNFHPTCKPVKLMSYLITLGSRPDDIVLDPFVGSGTTCVAAKILNRKYIGIEKESDYVKIARIRLKTSPTPML